MQIAKQSSSQDPWLMPPGEVRAVRFIEPTAIANDFGALRTASEPGGLLRAIQKAASWLMVETIFGLAAYGAAAHPCYFDCERDSADRRD